MKNTIIKSCIVLISITACAQNEKGALTKSTETTKNLKIQTVKAEPHRYGGWYCPDNLFGFPAVDIKDWQNVAVVNGRMPTKEECQNGTSLIFVDQEKYPNAKPLDIKMPQLAKIYNQSSRREEVIIIIQAVNIDNDSILGFRYLNGGNGSSKLNEANFLTEKEIDLIPKGNFVTLNFDINSTKDKVWNVLIKQNYSSYLQSTFDPQNKLPMGWRLKTNVNYFNSNSSKSTATYANEMYGNYYVQNDYEKLNYTEKFFVIENEETKKAELIIVCGPFLNDFEAQKTILNNWGSKVKTLSEDK